MFSEREIILEIDNIEAFYGKTQIIRGLSLEIPKNSIISVVGSNGAGKTTLLRTICGVIKPRKGTIEFMGERIDGLSTEKIVSRGISMVAEGKELFTDMTALENLQLGSYLKSKTDFNNNLEKVFELFPDLKDCLHKVAAALSGGQQQMLCIGMALMARPRLLLLDEPSLGLAPFLKEEIFSEISKISKEGETTILLVEQNVNMALSISEYGYILETGKIILEGESDSLLRNNLVKKAYLGQ